MAKVMLGGSAGISVIPEEVRTELGLLCGKATTFLIGDCKGADSAFQSELAGWYERVIVYYSGDSPRNAKGDWETQRIETDANPKTRAYYTAKDEAMCDDCDEALFIWDGSSKGTLRNINALMDAGKQVRVYRADLKSW